MLQGAWVIDGDGNGDERDGKKRLMVMVLMVIASECRLWFVRSWWFFIVQCNAVLFVMCLLKSITVEFPRCHIHTHHIHTHYRAHFWHDNMSSNNQKQHFPRWLYALLCRTSTNYSWINTMWSGIDGPNPLFREPTISSWTPLKLHLCQFVHSLSFLSPLFCRQEAHRESTRCYQLTDWLYQQKKSRSCLKLAMI